MVSFIILNHNTSELTLRCVKSINTYKPQQEYEIIIVDNHSNPDELRNLHKAEHMQHVRIIESQQNTGFGTGNMLGANFAKGQYLCFLNSDVVLQEDCISPLCEYLEHHSDIGAITPQQYNAQQKLVPAFNHAPGIRHEIFGTKLLENLFPSHYPKRKKILHKEPFNVAQINGSFMLFPKDKFWAIGGFDINIFLYYEEFDICKRLAKKGWKSIVHPQYSFMHIHGASIKSYKSLSYKELYISKMYCYRKHHNMFQCSIYRLIHIVKVLFNPHKWSLLPIVLKGETLSHSMRHLVQ